jgi:phytanoyl-CoA hydroxylase
MTGWAPIAQKGGTMKTELTAEQIAFYRENGFIVIEDFLTPTELEMWRGAIDEAVVGRGNAKLPAKTHPTTWKAGAREAVFLQRINLWMDNPKVRELILDRRVGKMATELEGVDGIRVWHDQVLTKMPWADATAWHQDNPKWSFTSDHAISIWVALDDATLQNGCLFFLPGTHRRRLNSDFGTGGSMGALFEANPELIDLEPAPAPMKAGSCSFHNGLTLHAANANITPGTRRAMTCAFMPDGGTFNGKQNVLPDEMVQRLKVGELLNDEKQNPLIYSQV